MVANLIGVVARRRSGPIPALAKEEEEAVGWLIAVAAGIVVPAAMLVMLPMLSRSRLVLGCSHVLSLFVVTVVAAMASTLVPSGSESQGIVAGVIGVVGLELVMVVAAVLRGKSLREAGFSDDGQDSVA